MLLGIYALFVRVVYGLWSSLYLVCVCVPVLRITVEYSVHTTTTVLYVYLLYIQYIQYNSRLRTTNSCVVDRPLNTDQLPSSAIKNGTEKQRTTLFFTKGKKLNFALNKAKIIL